MSTAPNVDEPVEPPHDRLSRRRLLGVLGAGAIGVGLGAGGARVAAADDTARTPASGLVVPFHGTHQAGITTAVQTNLHFASFDVTTSDRAELVSLLKRWTRAAERMCAGEPVGAGTLGDPLAPPDDPGEAVDHGAARLTLTIGFGPSLFDDRFGLAGQRPAALADLPRFPGDTLDPQRSGGDLGVQACSDDPQVAVHAIRTLSRLAAGVAAVRWAQLGFGKASTTTKSEQTPRNLFGFKDGTENVTADQAGALQSHVWADGADGAAWMAGGSYLVGRRIRMLIETWDRTPLQEQQDIFGRSKGDGVAYGRSREHDPVSLPDQPKDAHVGLAHPSANGGARMLRRGYNFVDGSDGLGHLDAGLFFLAYQRDPRTAFVRVQRSLARSDALNEYIRHTGSSLWAVPPGVQLGGWWGETLLS